MLLASDSNIRHHPMMMIGDRIRQARQRLKMTQDELAQALGVKQPTVSGWESDPSRRPERSIMPALAKALKVTPAWLEYGGLDDRARDFGDAAEDPPSSPVDDALLQQVLKMAMQSLVKPYGVDIPDRKFDEAADAAASAYRAYLRLRKENAA